MSKETRPLTAAELAYLTQLNNEAVVALQRHQEAQRRLVACVAFLREQHDAPEGKWGMNDLSAGFVRVRPKDEKGD